MRLLFLNILLIMVSGLDNYNKLYFSSNKYIELDNIKVKQMQCKKGLCNVGPDEIICSKTYNNYEWNCEGLFMNNIYKIHNYKVLCNDNLHNECIIQYDVLYNSRYIEKFLNFKILFIWFFVFIFLTFFIIITSSCMTNIKKPESNYNSFIYDSYSDTSDLSNSDLSDNNLSDNDLSDDLTDDDNTQKLNKKNIKRSLSENYINELKTVLKKRRY